MPFGAKKDSATGTKKTESDVNIFGMLIPVYIIFSIIAFVLIGYFNIKSALVNAGAGNSQAAMEQGYVSAFGQMYEAVAGNCQEPTLINFGEASVNVIDIACLQGAQAAPTEEIAEPAGE